MEPEVSVEPSRRRGRPRRRRPLGRRVVLWGGLVALLVLVGLALLLAWEARTAYAALTSASDRIPQLREQVIAGDDEATARTVAAFREDTASARDAVHGPHWSVLGALPEVGPNVRAVQTVTEVADDLADDALPELTAASTLIDPGNLAPRNGRIALKPIEEAAPHVVAAHRAIASADDRLSGIEPEPLADRLEVRVRDLADTLTETRGLTAKASTAARLLPSMLGSEGPRKYLVLAQNNAELRALGGIPGAAIVLRVDDGRIELLKQRPVNSVGPFEEPVLKLTRAELALFGTQPGRYLQNVTAIPDFPRAARLAQRMWRLETGQRVDGVLSVDPYTLQLLLRANGPVTLPSGQRLTGRNAAHQLLNQVYLDVLDPSAQDAFFGAAAAAVFEQAMSGDADPQASVEALAEAAEQGRVLVWSAHEEEQEVLEDTALGGVLRGSRDGHPVVGVYLHDRTASKIGYYQKASVRVRPTRCVEGRPETLRVRVTLSSRAPTNAATLPPYIAGSGAEAPKGHMLTAVLLYAPAGAVISEIRSSTGSNAVISYVHKGLHAAEKVVPLSPGERVRLSYDLRMPPGVGDTPVTRVTPLATPKQFSVSTSQCGQ